MNDELVNPFEWQWHRYHRRKPSLVELSIFMFEYSVYGVTSSKTRVRHLQMEILQLTMDSFMSR